MAVARCPHLRRLVGYRGTSPADHFSALEQELPMTQPGTTCFWCNVDPRKEMPNDISPHSTWCPQYRPPPSAAEVLRQFDALLDKPHSQS